MSLLENSYSEAIDAHRVWLGSFDIHYLRKWNNLLKSNPEAAICEAAIRKKLSDCIEIVEPYEDVSCGGPDFLCIQAETRFYVEVTCIMKKTATRATSLDEIQNTASCHSLLTDKIFGEMCNKASQCSNLDSPCILAIGTLHHLAGHICFDKYSAEQVLTGITYITATIDPREGRVIDGPHTGTKLQSAGFIRNNKNLQGKIEHARKTISAVLLCSLGTKPYRIIGVLHPNPNHDFDRNLLSDVKFCRLSAGYEDGRFGVEWI